MNSSHSLESTPLKSKKSLSLTSESPVSKTPEKQASQLQTRPRNRGVALSIKEIRQVAQTLPKPSTDRVKSARKQIWPTESPLSKISGDRHDKLPEKYEMLCEFFDSLDSAIRLLKLKGSMPTFRNISFKIECLTERRFTYVHLAQLKHILPEAIEIKKMMILDDRTSCMKPDLHIRIIVDAIDCGDKSKSGTKNLNVRKIFRSRLADFVKAHAEDDEIPEDDLPDPFNQSKKKVQLNLMKGPLPSYESSTDIQTELQSFTSQGELAESVNEQQPVAASHLSRSFQKRFSQKVTCNAQQPVKKCSDVSLQSSNVQVSELCADRFAFSGKTSSVPTQFPTEVLSKPTSSEMSIKSCLPATPVKEINPLKTEGIQSTPAKLASTPARLMTATPTLQPHKKCYMSPDEISSSSSSKLVRRPPRTRSLKFDTPVKEEKVDDEVHEMAVVPVDDDEEDILSILPESLLHSIKEKDRKAMEELDPAISQAKRRQRMIACLPKLFNTIHYLFQSIKRSVITKEELMHKIIAGHCDIVDRGEVEEQLKLLQELAPEWISEKLASAGDLLVCINKVSSPESIRMRLQEAK